MSVQGEAPKNHMVDNMTKIKKLMRNVKERDAQKEIENAPVPVKALWKSEKWKDVQSKLKLEMSVSGNMSAKIK